MRVRQLNEARLDLGTMASAIFQVATYDPGDAGQMPDGRRLRFFSRDALNDREYLVKSIADLLKLDSKVVERWFAGAADQLMLEIEGIPHDELVAAKDTGQLDELVNGRIMGDPKNVAASFMISSVFPAVQRRLIKRWMDAFSRGVREGIDLSTVAALSGGIMDAASVAGATGSSERLAGLWLTNLRNRVRLMMRDVPEGEGDPLRWIARKLRYSDVESFKAVVAGLGVDAPVPGINEARIEMTELANVFFGGDNEQEAAKTLDVDLKVIRHICLTPEFKSTMIGLIIKKLEAEGYKLVRENTTPGWHKLVHRANKDAWDADDSDFGTVDPNLVGEVLFRYEPNETSPGLVDTIIYSVAGHATRGPMKLYFFIERLRR